MCETQGKKKKPTKKRDHNKTAGVEKGGKVKRTPFILSYLFLGGEGREVTFEFVQSESMGRGCNSRWRNSPHPQLLFLPLSVLHSLSFPLPLPPPSPSLFSFFLFELISRRLHAVCLLCAHSASVGVAICVGADSEGCGSGGKR